MTDLKLKSTALDELKLPIAVSAGTVYFPMTLIAVLGHIGHLKVEVSWTSLLKSPIVVHIDEGGAY